MLSDYFIANFPLPGNDSYTNIKCSGNGMAIFLTKKLLPSFNHSSFHLNNNSCTGHQLNHSHIILETGFSERSFNGSYVHANLVHGHLKNPRNCSLKNITTRFDVECKEPALAVRNNKSSLSHLNLPKVGSEEVYVKAESKLHNMSLLAHEGKLLEPLRTSTTLSSTTIFEFETSNVSTALAVQDGGVRLKG